MRLIFDCTLNRVFMMRSRRLDSTTRPSDDLTFSVIIPVETGNADFNQCLLSLTALDPPPCEIIVVTSSNGGSAHQLAKGFGSEVLELSGIKGPAQKRNAGARIANGDILFFVDSDVTVPKAAMAQVMEAFQGNPNLAALIGSYDDEPLKPNFFSQYKNLVHHYVHQNSNEKASTFWGACGAIRKEVLLSVNGFDERYLRPSVEDIELGYRLTRIGHRILLLKNLQVKHLKRWSFSSMVRTDIFYRALPWTQLMLSQKRIIKDLNLKMSDRISTICCYLLLLSLLLCFKHPWYFGPFVFAAAVLLLFLNWDLYRFLGNKCGLVFAIKSIPVHWLYFTYSGLAFATGFMRFVIKTMYRTVFPSKEVLEGNPAKRFHLTDNEKQPRRYHRGRSSRS